MQVKGARWKQRGVMMKLGFWEREKEGCLTGVEDRQRLYHARSPSRLGVQRTPSTFDSEVPAYSHTLGEAYALALTLRAISSSRTLLPPEDHPLQGKSRVHSDFE